ERRRAQSPAGHHPRSGDELLLPEGRAGRRLHLRRADSGRPSDRVAADHWFRSRGAACCTLTRTNRDFRVRVVILYDPGADDWTAEDVAGVMEAVDHIARIFVTLNHQVQRVPVRHDMRWFNVCCRA